MRTIHKLIGIFLGILLTILSPSCKKFVEIDPPRTDLIKKTVFENDQMANAAVLDLYYSIEFGISSLRNNSITYLASIYADEQNNFYTASPESQVPLEELAKNQLVSSNKYVLKLWSDMYKFIYKANAVLEGIAGSSNMTDVVKGRLSGEAKFVRAFCYFYLVNLFGDVPLILSTDYKVNSTISRTVQSQVYQQMVLDLKDAANLLPDSYSLYSNERVRVNKSAAHALLARVYLFSNDWVGAEDASSKVIDNFSLYQLNANLSQVVSKNNKEAIWQLWSDYYPNELFIFYIFGSSPNYGALRPGFIGNFEANDQRLTNWIGNSNGFYFARKYSSFTLTEYSTVMRLAEQYLIRAEARAKQGKVSGANSAESDINVIRNRAGLGNTTASTQQAMLLAIEQERKVELFTEWGHRWFDLKRTGKADAVLAPIKPQWRPTAVLFPIPEAQIINNPNITQNPGY